jgi:apolipoprotein N-acyltransferase
MEELRNLTPAALTASEAHRAIRDLWQKQKNNYAPLIAILVHTAVAFPAITEAWLQEEINNGEKTSPQESKHPTQGDQDKKTTPPKTKPTDSTTVITSEDAYVRLYRRLPRLWKSVYIQQLTQYWQQNHSKITSVPEAKETSKEPQEDKEQKKNSIAIPSTPASKFTSTQQACLKRLHYETESITNVPFFLRNTCRKAG